MKPITKQKQAGYVRGAVLQILLISIGLFSILPVVLLPLITSTPLPIAALLAGADLFLIYLFRRSTLTALTRSFLVGGMLLVACLAVFVSQHFALTPPIRAAGEDAVSNGIATLETVEINGHKHWLTIRGENIENPVLLFLSGGPGGSQLAATRKVLGDLEEHFTVVNWEQPGSGKSFNTRIISQLTPQRYREDSYALTCYLLNRFKQEKIYVVGESWGSILGIWMIQDHPENFHAFVGIAPMVAFLETDLHDYFLALEITRENGDNRTHEALLKQGPPPYYGRGTAWKASRYLMVLSQHMMRDPNITGPGYDTFGDIFSSEYGLYDKVNYFRGLLAVMDVMWPQLWEVDLRLDAVDLQVPVYFAVGRHDINAPPYLVESYMEILEAPYKKLIWFEHSGHSPWVDESKKFVDLLVNSVKEGPRS